MKVWLVCLIIEFWSSNELLDDTSNIPKTVVFVLDELNMWKIHVKLILKLLVDEY